MELKITKAERKQKKLKAAIVGVSGSGKTYSALELATGLTNGGRILVADTERGSSTLYADRFDFDVVDLPDTGVETYIKVIDLAAKSGYDVLVIDSASHAWEWLLEEADNVQKRNRSYNSFTAWSQVTPIYKKLVQKIISSPLHVIATMRAKSEYVMEEYSGHDGKTKQKPTKVGLAPIFRQGGEYEFDLIINIDLEHSAVVEKSRLDFLADKVIKKPGRELGKEIRDWLASGKAEAPQEKESPPAKEQEEEAFITADQALGLTVLADEAGILVAKICQSMGIEDLGYLPASKYGVVEAKLRAKISAKGAQQG